MNTSLCFAEYVTTSEKRMTEIPFEIDALIDPISLTYSPNIFYEMLQREIRRCERNGGELTLISLDLTESLIPAEQMREILMKISIIVKQRLRSHEFFCRIGLEKFAILIHGNEFEASKALERLKDGFEECGITVGHSSVDLKFTIQVISWKSHMTLIDWLEAAAL